MHQPALGFLLCNKLVLLFLSDHEQMLPQAEGGPTWKVRLIGVQLSTDYGVTFDLPEVLPFYGPVRSKVSH